MDRFERIKQVTEQINDSVERCQREYDMTVAEMLGILEIIKLNIHHEEAHGEDHI